MTDLPEAMNKRGNKLYRHGKGNPAHFDDALDAYRIAAEAGITNAQFYYARMHQYGHGCAKDYEVALQFYQEAAKSGDRRAWNNLGYMLKNGQGLVPNSWGSLLYYTQASKMGMAMGSYNIGLHYHTSEGVKDYVKAIQFYTLATEQSQRYRKAYNQIGRIYENGGHGLEPDLQKAYRAFLLAATFGDEYGVFNLGRFYRDGKVVDKDLSMAEKLFLEAAHRGHDSAWNTLGNLFYLNRYEQQDFEKALEYYLKAYKAGKSKYLYRLGYLLKSGPKHLVDPDKAFEVLTASAELNQPYGIRSLGYCYAYGIGTEIDRDKAEFLWLTCGGESLIQWHQLGLLMAREDTDQPPDLALAEAYFKKGTTKDPSGCAECWRRLGYLYRDAPPPKRDYQQAQVCFQQAVKLGDEPAKVALSHLENNLLKAAPQ